MLEVAGQRWVLQTMASVAGVPPSFGLRDLQGTVDDVREVPVAIHVRREPWPVPYLE